jgi:hypothetical protein
MVPCVARAIPPRRAAAEVGATRGFDVAVRTVRPRLQGWLGGRATSGEVRGRGGLDWCVHRRAPAIAISAPLTSSEDHPGDAAARPRRRQRRVSKPADSSRGSRARRLAGALTRLELRSLDVAAFLAGRGSGHRPVAHRGEPAPGQGGTLARRPWCRSRDRPRAATGRDRGVQIRTVSGWRRSAVRGKLGPT